MEVCEAMFLEGRIFHQEPNHTYTHEMLKAMRQEKQLWFGKGAIATLGGWPVSQAALEKLVFYARGLYDMAKAFFDVNFPDFAWRTKFRAFDCSLDSPGRLPEVVRLDFVEQLATKELR